MIRLKRLPTRERLAELLSYHPETGEFLRITAIGNFKAGVIAGRINAGGYREIGIDGARHYAHRLAFVAMTGSCPDRIDHINRVRDENRWANLRPATQTQNCGNTGLSRANTSGVKGVSWYRASAKWRADIMVNGQSYFLGYFDNITDAAEAYRVAAVAAFGEYANPVRNDAA